MFDLQKGLYLLAPGISLPTMLLIYIYFLNELKDVVLRYSGTNFQSCSYHRSSVMDVGMFHHFFRWNNLCNIICWNDIKSSAKKTWNVSSFMYSFP